jgi:hypothetical protein
MSADRPSLLLPALLLPLALLAACQEYGLKGDRDVDKGDDENTGDVTGTDGGDTTPEGCDVVDYPAEERGVDDVCTPEPPGGFDPITEWAYGAGKGCLSQPIVADLDRDGMPEVIFNLLPSFFAQKGHLTVIRGDGSALVWDDTNAQMAYGSPPAVGDIDGDGSADIVIVREYTSALFNAGDYTAAAYDANGNELWESDHFVGLDFDWATAPNIRDMDHDGFPEVIVGRVILNGADGSTRGIGEHGRGSYGIVSLGSLTVSESSVPAVTDLDLDGMDEVIVGNAMYDADGNTIWHDPSADDGMIGIANLDDDPEGEFVATTYNTIRAVDTDGTVMWGPIELPTANILSPVAIADLDGDGLPELVTAGGNELVVHANGSVYWRASVTDESGATGASFFDFEGDGILEVVYIDEVQMVVYDGQTGAVKFYNTEHGSNTMMDYPTVADVDADGEAEIIVCHNSFGSAVSAFGDRNHSWRPARKLWNQHAYDITNINDDLTVPTTAVPGFTTHNTWHSAMGSDPESVGLDIQAEIANVCTDDCATGRVTVMVRLLNTAPEDLTEPVWMTLYAEVDGTLERVQSTRYTLGVPSGWTTEGVLIEVPADALDGASSLLLVADDDGAGVGEFVECSETNNQFAWEGPFCE